MPARCRQCDWTGQPDVGLNVSGVQGLTLRNITVPCPRCGGPAEVIEGRFNVVDGAIDMLSGPAWTADLIRDLRLALVRSIEQGTDPAAELDQVDPRAGRAFRAALFDKPANLAHTLAGYILGSIVTDYTVARGNILAVVQAVNDVLKYVSEHGALPGQ